MTEKLTLKELLKKMAKNLRHIEKMSFLEQYAMFMGKAQIVELALKDLLNKKYKYKYKKIEKYTLGNTIYELNKCKLRPDFIALLRELLGYRNSFGARLFGADCYRK